MANETPATTSGPFELSRFHIDDLHTQNSSHSDRIDHDMTQANEIVTLSNDNSRMTEFNVVSSSTGDENGCDKATKVNKQGPSSSIVTSEKVAQ